MAAGPHRRSRDPAAHRGRLRGRAAQRPARERLGVGPGAAFQPIRARPAVERTLGQELSRWLLDCEALPEFAVSAIAITLEDETLHQVDADAAEPIEVAGTQSPERAVSELETLLSDPAFALALHCIDV